MNSLKSFPFKRIAFIGDYLPRRCGIATFTTDLCESIAGELPDTCCFAVPVNDREEGYAYPPRVRFEIEESDPASYRRAADFLNINRVDLVCLQHEYGIYGGSAKEPDAAQRRVMSRLAAFSDRLVVMSHLGVKFLREIYNIPESKIDFIPHGIPDVPFVDSSFYKDHFGVEGKQVLLTFGLLSPNKGIEYAIEALPAILERHPNVVYIVLGATHPHVQRADGESYRLQLQRLARTKGVERNILFFDQFVGIEELVEFIGAADIYLTPYLNPAQITSGTLAYTVGAGKAVVSTPYWYAEELLGEGRGLLIPFADSKAIAERVIELLDNDTERHAMRKRAYMLGREMTWPRVAQRYLESFVQAAEERKQRPRAAFKVPTLDTRPPYLLPLNLNHLRQMTDDTGLVQHAYFTVPNYHEGYATDDNARGLIVAVYLEERGENPQNEISVLASRYLAFLINSFSSTANRFRNFLSYDRRWQEKIGSEDCHGRSLWGLGTVIGRSKQPGLRGAAAHLFEAALPTTENFASPRAWAFTLLAIHEYRKRFGGDTVARRLMETLSKRLLEIYRRNYTADWPWFEYSLTYCNAVLPHALLVCGQTLGEEEMIETGLRSLEWLAHLQQATQGHFVPVGSNGFYPRGGERARFDQQPVEAQAMVSACLTAKAVTDNSRWDQHLHRAFDWFLGHNDLGLSLYDPATGGCRDGLHSDRCNQNEGAESTLAFLHSLLEICLAETPSPADPAEESSPVSPKSEAVAAKRD